MHLVGEHIARCLSLEWEDADDAILDEEGSALLPIVDTGKLLRRYCQVDNQVILEHIASVLPAGPWMRKNFFIGEQHHQMMWAWEEFCKYVMHKRRYSFFRTASDEVTKEETEGALLGDISPHEMLKLLGDAVSSENLIKQTQTGVEIYYRARVGYFSKEEEIREPKPEKARASNRMSPAGIPMFYGCHQQRAALWEIYNEEWAKDGDIITVGKFEMAQPIGILNLSNTPPLPSLFDEGNNQRRMMIIFLREFAKEIAKPIIKDGRENIEYVPTQVLTEYFRMGSPSIDDEIGGIEYISAHRADTPPERKEWTCVALFDSECLRLAGVEYFRASVKKGKSEKPEVDFHQVHLSAARES